MNCESAKKFLSAERDETLGAEVRVALETHVAGCGNCRKLRAILAESAAAWRVNTSTAQVPDERLEWQRIRRRLHADQVKPGWSNGWSGVALWRGVAVAAAAAVIALGVFMRPRASEPTAVSAAAVAMTDTVEVGGDAASAMVFVDEKSGWLVVWAASAADGG